MPVVRRRDGKAISRNEFVRSGRSCNNSVELVLLDQRYFDKLKSLIAFGIILDMDHGTSFIDA